RSVLSVARGKLAWGTIRSGIGSPGITTKPCRSWPRGSSIRRRDGGKNLTPALTVPQLRQLIGGLIEVHLKANRPSSLCRRSTRWLRRIEQARFFHYSKRNLLPPLRNNLRT